MADGVPPFATYVPGASSGENNQRRQPVRAVTTHRTQGNDSRGLGQNRTHSSPGTFNFLLRDEACYCYYPAWVRCSHAAGANRSGPGIEIEGFTGNPISAKQSAWLGQLAHWLHDTYGVPLSLYDGMRRQIDGTSFAGFVNHNSVLTEPQYAHTDRISPSEFNHAIELGDDMPLNESDKLWIISTVNDIVNGNPVEKQTDGTIKSLWDRIRGTAAGGGLSADQVRAIVRAEIDKTKLGV